MFVKMITCEVKEGMREAFSTGQRCWSDLKGCAGFIAQYGGWSTEKRDLANIIGFWEDHSYYEQFMEDRHDLIYKKTGQKGTIASIEVELNERVIEDIGEYTSTWLISVQSEIHELWSITTSKNEVNMNDK